MSGHGVVHTLASVVSPAAGAVIVGAMGFSATFSSLGYLLILTGVIALLTMPQGLARQPQPLTEPAKPALAPTDSSKANSGHGPTSSPKQFCQFPGVILCFLWSLPALKVFYSLNCLCGRRPFIHDVDRFALLHH